MPLYFYDKFVGMSAGGQCEVRHRGEAEFVLHGNLRQQQRLEALQQFKARVCGISHPISQTRKLLPTCCRGMTTKPLRSS